MGPRAKAQRQHISSFFCNGSQYKVGTCVLVNPDTKGGNPFVGKIKDIIQHGNSDEDIELTVAWYYRPEEAVGGRKPFHGEKELFESEHNDTIHKNTVLGKCRVYTLAKYEELTVITDQDFFVRFKYKPATKQFEPDEVPVYCVCEMPYNPDRPMIMCESCDEWYHLDCLREPLSTLPLDRSYTCQECRQKAAQLANGEAVSNKRVKAEEGQPSPSGTLHCGGLAVVPGGSGSAALGAQSRHGAVQYGRPAQAWDEEGEGELLQPLLDDVSGPPGGRPREACIQEGVGEFEELHGAGIFRHAIKIEDPGDSLMQGAAEQAAQVVGLAKHPSSGGPAVQQGAQPAGAELGAHVVGVGSAARFSSSGAAVAPAVKPSWSGDAMLHGSEWPDAVWGSGVTLATF